MAVELFTSQLLTNILPAVSLNFEVLTSFCKVFVVGKLEGRVRYPLSYPKMSVLLPLL